MATKSNTSLAAGNSSTPTIWHTVDDIDVTAWNAVSDPDDLFMDLRLLRVVERSMSSQARFRYVLFRDQQGQPAATACLCTYVVDGTLLTAEGPLKRLLGLIGKFIPFVVKYRVLFCGMPFSAGQSHLRFADQADHSAILSSLCQLMDDVAKADRARVIIFKEFADTDRSTMDQVQRHGYRRADSLPMNVASGAFLRFDEYLASLKSHTRNNIRRSLKRLNQGGIQIVSTSDTNEIETLFTSEVHRLYSAVFQHSETRLEYLPIEFFHEIPRQLPENCRFWFLMKQGQVYAFGTSIFSRKSHHPLFAGIDYRSNSEFDLYFNILYATFADALERGVDEIHMGQDADYFKQSKLGCHQEARCFYVKGARPPIRLVFRLLFHQLFPPRPLKAPKSSNEQA